MLSDGIRDYPSDGGIYDQCSWMFENLPILLLEFVGMLGLVALFAFLAFAKRVLKPTADFEE